MTEQIPEESSVSAKGAFYSQTIAVGLKHASCLIQSCESGLDFTIVTPIILNLSWARVNLCMLAKTFSSLEFWRSEVPQQ